VFIDDWSSLVSSAALIEGNDQDGEEEGRSKLDWSCHRFAAIPI